MAQRTATELGQVNPNYSPPGRARFIPINGSDPSVDSHSSTDGTRDGTTTPVPRARPDMRQTNKTGG